MEDPRKAALDQMIQFAKGLMVSRRAGAAKPDAGADPEPEVPADGVPGDDGAEPVAECAECGAEMDGDRCAACEGEPEMTVVGAGRIGAPAGRSSKMPVAKKKYGGF